jgi:hypothetical protein
MSIEELENLFLWKAARDGRLTALAGIVGRASAPAAIPRWCAHCAPYENSLMKK